MGCQLDLWQVQVLYYKECKNDHEVEEHGQPASWHKDKHSSIRKPVDFEMFSKQKFNTLIYESIMADEIISKR